MASSRTYQLARHRQLLTNQSGGGYSICGGLYIRGALPDVCKRRADGAAYAGVRCTVRLGHDSLAMASYAARAWPGHLRVESSKADLGAVAKSDHPYWFRLSALLFLQVSNALA